MHYLFCLVSANTHKTYISVFVLVVHVIIAHVHLLIVSMSAATPQ